MCYFPLFDLQAEQGFYFIGEDLSVLLKQKFQLLIGEKTVATPQQVEVVMGRKLQVLYANPISLATHSFAKKNSKE